jgi:excisionase family DNA binding protein
MTTRFEDRTDNDLSTTYTKTVSDGPANGRLLLSIIEAAASLGISRAYAYELVNRNELHTVKIGRRRMVRVSDLLVFVEALEVAPPGFS